MAPGTLSGTTWVSWYQKGKTNQEGKTNLDLLEQEIVSGSGISWAIGKFAPCPRQIIMSESNHSVFYRPDALPAAKPTALKHMLIKSVNFKNPRWCQPPSYKMEKLWYLRNRLTQFGTAVPLSPLNVVSQWNFRNLTRSPAVARMLGWPTVLPQS